MELKFLKTLGLMGVLILGTLGVGAQDLTQMLTQDPGPHPQVLERALGLSTEAFLKEMQGFWGNVPGVYPLGFTRGLPQALDLYRSRGPEAWKGLLRDNPFSRLFTPSEMVEVLGPENAVLIENFNFYLRIEPSPRGLAEGLTAAAQSLRPQASPELKRAVDFWNWDPRMEPQDWARAWDFFSKYPELNQAKENLKLHVLARAGLLPGYEKPLITPNLETQLHRGLLMRWGVLSPKDPRAFFLDPLKVLAGISGAEAGGLMGLLWAGQDPPIPGNFKAWWDSQTWRNRWFWSQVAEFWPGKGALRKLMTEKSQALSPGQLTTTAENASLGSLVSKVNSLFGEPSCTWLESNGMVWRGRFECETGLQGIQLTWKLPGEGWVLGPGRIQWSLSFSSGAGRVWALVKDRAGRTWEWIWDRVYGGERYSNSLERLVPKELFGYTLVGWGVNLQDGVPSLRKEPWTDVNLQIGPGWFERSDP